MLTLITTVATFVQSLLEAKPLQGPPRLSCSLCFGNNSESYLGRLGIISSIYCGEYSH